MAESAAPAKPTIKVMAVGDSLTAAPYYRARFVTAAREAGESIEMVGPEKDSTSSGHAGYSGKPIGHINHVISTHLKTHNPDVVLLQIGTNNMNHGLGISMPEAQHYPNNGTSALAAELQPPIDGSYLNGLGSRWGDATYGTTYLKGEITTLINTILSNSPTTKLVVAKIPPIGKGNSAYLAHNDACNARIKEFNSLLEAAYSALSDADKKRIVVIDNFTGVNREYGPVAAGHAFGTDAVQAQDWVHFQPDSNAWTQMGDNFYKGFAQVIAVP